MTRWSAVAFGLRIRSSHPVPGLISIPDDADTAVDLEIKFLHQSAFIAESECPVLVHEAEERDAHGNPVLRLHADPAKQRHLFHYADGTEFLLSGSRIEARWPASLTLKDTATYLLGPILGFILTLRGDTCLHASAVAKDGWAIAFAGDAGAGKSTTATYFAQQGWEVLTDDIACLRRIGEQIHVIPGYPRLRLWDDSAESLFGSAAALPLLTPTWDKRFVDLQDPRYTFCREPMPLRALYWLSETEYPGAASVSPIGAREAFLLLVAGVYGSERLEPASEQANFPLLTGLANRIPVRHLHRRKEFAFLPDVYSAVMRDFADIRREGGK